ncbi:MAG: hypothetical protein IIC74_11535, partial [Bacteroidetes bacterium]|nr:hypothetical protein [Bacteroidota bacterium]
MLRDRVYIKFQLYTLYPNIYTILLSAGSSNTRKSIPLRQAQKLLKAVDNTIVIAGTATIPGIIKMLGEGHTNKKGRTTKGASGIIVATELTSFIKRDFNAVEKFTDLYDGHADWPDIT